MKDYKKQAEEIQIKVRKFLKEYPMAGSSLAFVEGYKLGFKEASQWNSLDEKPDEGVMEILLLLYNNEAYYHDIGYYNFQDNMFHAFNSDSEHIVKWQYLPKI